MKILVMGATGFLGKRIVKRLTEDGIPYLPVSRSLGTDFRNLEEFEEIFLKNNDITHIFNCATFIGGIQFGLEHTGEIYYDNSLINTYMFELARKYNIQRVINPISNCSYPRDVQGSFAETDWWSGELDPSVMVYGFIRKGSWVQSWAYFKQYGLKTINLIVPNMYGPNDHFDEVRSHALGALIMKIVNAKMKKQTNVVVWGTGKPVREWLYVDDCVEAMARSIMVDHFEYPVNIGIGYGVSIKELAEMIKNEIGYEGELVFDLTKPDGAPYKVMDVTLCKQVFGWVPQTPLADGISKTIAWYQSNYSISKVNNGIDE
jgi:GDP-L-fucose synthase